MKEYNIIFWDFDGVIKESVAVKSVAFGQLFLQYGREVAGRVRQHHEAHGGVSRYEKIPIYLAWAGEAVTEDKVHDFCDKFSELVLQAVIDSDWVPGVREYLQANYARQCFILVTATPLEEIQQIVQSLQIAPYFKGIFGAPTSKTVAIRDALQRMNCSPEQALVVGDSETDLDAAKANNVAFLLRRTTLNRVLQEQYSGPMFDNLSDE
ncbi:MAG: HAD family hydrolase [Gammaproteobacteria bacterium]|nr:HAD family hydrolase [Gammaproteobacteria bacterium]